MLPERDAKTKGKLVAYMKTLLATIALPPRWFKITTGGKSFKVQASGVFICNVEDLGIGRDTNLTLLRDGVFDLHIINPTILKDYIALTRRYGAGNMSDNPTDTVIRVKEAVVEMVPRHGIQSKFQEFAKKVLSVMTGKSINPPPRDEQMRCMIDGDVHSVTPMRVTVIPKAVNVLVPPARKQDIRPDLVLSNSNSTEVPNIKDNVRKLPKASNQ
jgi:diacylglycerol kinase family enzyme